MESKMSEELQAQIREIQAVQEQMQMLAYQNQQLSASLREIDRALEELGKASGAVYRFAGGVVIERKKDELVKELKDEKETVELRVKTFKTQEDKLKAKFEELRKVIESKMPKK